MLPCFLSEFQDVKECTIINQNLGIRVQRVTRYSTTVEFLESALEIYVFHDVERPRGLFEVQKVQRIT